MFELETSLVFWSLVSFGLLLALLYKFALPPILNIMEERKNKIAGDLLQAQNEKTRAQELAAAGKQKLQETIKHADQIITESRAEAQAEKQTILTAAENRAVKAIDRAKEKIKSEENRARQELKASVATLVAEAGGKLIGKSLSEKEHLKLIEKSLAELETHL